MDGKERLDALLQSRGLFPSRERARSAIMAGVVFVNGNRVDKPGTRVDAGARLEVRGGIRPYVSRGGLKLEKALKSFGIDLAGRVVLDVGASTGGFADCALQNGAARIYAVDVGYGQLDWKLRQDPRVVCLERTNIRHLSGTLLEPRPDFFTIDVAFISLKLVFPKVDELTTPGAAGVALVKPQFEAGREKVGKKGVVRDPGVHIAVISGVLAAARTLGWGAAGLDYAPFRGPQGNIEYLAYFRKGTADVFAPEPEIARVVTEAHEKL
ncbi:MAG: TlyA family RNA methyltransferase [Candidatus Desulforudis sp.]|nr:TlyA family RNA methyltransferase [Desulforudis sp.]